MERAGFKVDMQSMDWRNLLSCINKKTARYRWMECLSGFVRVRRHFQSRGDTYPKRRQRKGLVPGWLCDAMEKLRDQFAHETDPVIQKQIAEAVQVRATEVTAHVTSSSANGILWSLSGEML
jgi:peptide/nickel transport system substrate-binding protein